MPTYEYQCESCEHKWEQFESIHEHVSGGAACVECGEHANQVFDGTALAVRGPAVVRKDPTTVGHLASRNREKMGKYEYEEKVASDKFEQIKEKRKKNAPWWRPNTTQPSKEAFQAATELGNVAKGEAKDVSDNTRKFLTGED